MEFANRKACIEHFQEGFPRLPRYMIEMALDYDLSNGGETGEKPLTGKQKRHRKKALASQPKRDTSVQDMIESALKTGQPMEIDCAQVVKDYEMAPLVKGYISTEGMLSQAQETEVVDEEVLDEGQVDDFLIHRDDDCEEECAEIPEE